MSDLKKVGMWTVWRCEVWRCGECARESVEVQGVEM